MKIVLFARDPGGSNVVVSLYQKMVDHDYSVKLYIKDYVEYVRNKFGIEPLDIMAEVDGISESTIMEFLRQEAPDFVITGTSADDMTEKLMWQCAGALGIKTVAILDQWMNYGIRFSKYGLSEMERYNVQRVLDRLPDKICVMDDLAYSEMIKEGHDPSRLVIAGHPYFQYIKEKYFDLNSGIHHDEKEIRILFASEPISKFYPQNELGYTEKTIITEVVAALERILEATDPVLKIELVIKPHPQEPPGSYDSILHNGQNRGLSIRLSDNGDSLALISQSDVVVGMSSMALIEAYMLKKPVVSVRIGGKNENPFILDQLGLIRTVTETDKLISELQRCMIEPQSARPEMMDYENSSERIIDLLEGLK